MKESEEVTAVLDDRSRAWLRNRLAGPDPDVTGLEALVIGMGISGRAAAELLRTRGARVIGYDRDARVVDALRPEWEPRGVRFQTGELEPGSDIDFCVISPGVPPFGRFFDWLKEENLPLLGELEWACRYLHRPIAAVSGTNGKTTVVHMIDHVLRLSGRGGDLVGNVGAAVSDLVLHGECRRAQPVVMEVSSFQCETMDEFKPAVAVITNLAPDHLDRYPDVEAYYRVKFQLANRLAPNEALWLGPGVEGFCPCGVVSRTPRFGFRDEGTEGLFFLHDKIIYRLGTEEGMLPCPTLEHQLPQQVLNALAAAGACHDLGVPLCEAFQALESFPPLPHRLQWVHEVKGVSCYNDSKATNIHAMEAALRSLPAPIRLIAGGRPKGESLEPVRALIQEKVVAVYLIGEAAATFAEAWQPLTRVARFDTLEAAVHRALSDGIAGESLLLSPGCASWDMFRNYTERGERFTRAVKEFQP